MNSGIWDCFILCFVVMGVDDFGRLFICCPFCVCGNVCLSSRLDFCLFFGLRLICRVALYLGRLY